MNRKLILRMGSNMSVLPLILVGLVQVDAHYGVSVGSQT